MDSPDVDNNHRQVESDGDPQQNLVTGQLLIDKRTNSATPTVDEDNVDTTNIKDEFENNDIFASNHEDREEDSNLGTNFFVRDTTAGSDNIGENRCLNVNNEEQLLFVGHLSHSERETEKQDDELSSRHSQADAGGDLENVSIVTEDSEEQRIETHLQVNNENETELQKETGDENENNEKTHNIWTKTSSTQEVCVEDQGITSDQELEDFFNTKPVSLDEGNQDSHFPALDNVDFETDEEGQDVNKEVRTVGAENEARPGEESDNSKADNGLENSGQGDPENKANVKPAGHDIDKNKTVDNDGDKGISAKALTSPRLNKDDYPLNYQNYQICRELTPGVQECLILETGEQVVLVTDPHTSVDKTVEPLLSGKLPVEELPSDKPSFRALPSELPSEVLTTKYESPTTKSDGFIIDDNSPENSPMHKSSCSADEFVHTSYDYESGHFEPGPDNNAESSLRAFISDHGIPIIMDSMGSSDENDGNEMLTDQNSHTLQRSSLGDEVRGSGNEILTDHNSQVLQSNSSGIETRSDVGALRENIVEDVLCSDEEKNSDGTSVGSSKTKKQRFYELQPDLSVESLEEPDNTNNNKGSEDEQGEANSNNNANDRLAENYPPFVAKENPPMRDVSFKPSQFATSRPYPSESTLASSSYRHSSVVPDSTSSRSYSQQSYRDESVSTSRGQRSHDDSSYYRSMGGSSEDMSRLSTRYTRIERGDPRIDASKSESVTIPKFKTLHDQQVSWLDMFKMIEEQHKCELQSQYQEHQKILQEMQRNMEKELTKQQATLKKRLNTHREILEELSPSRRSSKKRPDIQNINQSRRYDDEDDAPAPESYHQVDRLSDSASHITLMGVPVSLRNPPPLNRYVPEYNERKSSDEIPIKTSLELSSPSRPADTSLNLSRLTLGSDKQLRGGVYSSPMPLAKSKLKNSPRGSKSYDDAQHNSPRGDSCGNSVHWAYDGHSRDGAPTSRPTSGELTESDDVLSPRTRISLREKHAKHLADLRAYYEEELREMRQLLSLRQERNARDIGTSGMTAEEKILANENQELKQKCQEFQDIFHDAKIEIRELQQKIQGLEIRASDYAERFDTSQAQVLSLKTRLEEVTEFAKEKEAIAAELELKHKKTVEALQMAYKKEKELTDSNHSAKTAIQRLVDKYETLEKDYSLAKESLSSMEEKLLNSRTEVMEANNKFTRLELENKQLKHDNEILKHELTMARSSLSMRTSYEDSYHSPGGVDRGRPSYSSPNVSRTRSADRSYHARTETPTTDRSKAPKDNSTESDTDSDLVKSPILRAERELRNLQKSLSSQGFTPKLQKKFYGSEMSMRSVGQSSNNAMNGHSPNEKQVRQTENGRQSNARSSEYSRASIRGENSRHAKDGGADQSRSKERTVKDRDQKGKTYSSPTKKSQGGESMSGDQALERVRSGDIVSRPAWEDMYTSMVQTRPENISGKLAALNSTRDMMIRERLQNIENLERKYDDLSHEKRKYESALNKLPAQGHRAEKDKLEAELDRVDRELGSVRMSLKRYHVLKSTI